MPSEKKSGQLKLTVYQPGLATNRSHRYPQIAIRVR